MKVTSASKATSATKAIPAAAKVEDKKTSQYKDRYRILEPDDFHAVEQSLDHQSLGRNRQRLLWPGIWTILAVAGTYGVFAYMDANYGDATSRVTLQPDRLETSDSWLFTPTVIRDGIKAGWQDLGKLTVGIIGLSAAIHVLRRSDLFSLVKLVHIAGQHRYTAFTHPFIYKNWVHLGRTSLILCWVLPGVVRHFDGDLWHTAAFLVSVPLIMVYLQHFVFRFTTLNGIPTHLGAAPLCLAIFGAYCVAYADEKMWTPAGIVLRLESEYWGLLYIAAILLLNWNVTGGSKALNILFGPGYFGLGAAYVYFNGEDNVWKPLVERFSARNTAALSSGQ